MVIGFEAVGGKSLPEAVKNEGIAVVAIVETLADAADGGCARAGFFADVEIVHLFSQKGGNLKPLRHIEKFLFGAKVAEKRIALLKAFERKDGAEKVVDVFTLNFSHICFSPAFVKFTPSH